MNAIPDEAEIQSVIKSILVQDLFVEIPADEIGLDDGLRTVAGLDSLGFVELRVQCENRFGIHIPDDDFDPQHFTSVRSLATLATRLLQTRGERV